MWDGVIYLLLGLVVGALGGLFGIGGGMLATPLLGVMLEMDQSLAQGTALVMVVPNVIMAVWRYNQHQPIQWRAALPLVVSSLLFAILGAYWALQWDVRSLRWAFIGFMWFLIVNTLLRGYLKAKQGKPASDRSPSSLGLFTLLGIGAGSGAAGGIFGVGGALVATPILTTVLGVGQFAAQGLALSLAVPSTSTTLLMYASHQQVDWSVGLPMAVGGLISVSWGVRWAHALPERLLQTLFCVFLAVCSVLLVNQA